MGLLYSVSKNLKYEYIKSKVSLVFACDFNNLKKLQNTRLNFSALSMATILYTSSVENSSVVSILRTLESCVGVSFAIVLFWSFNLLRNFLESKFTVVLCKDAPFCLFKKWLKVDFADRPADPDLTSIVSLRRGHKHIGSLQPLQCDTMFICKYILKRSSWFCPKQ